MVFFSGRAKYLHEHILHCHFCIQIITDHLLLSKVSHPIHTIPGINGHLLYPILYPWKYSIRHKLLYCPVCILGFHGNQRCIASYHYFYTWGVLQEVDIISTVRPYGQVNNLWVCGCKDTVSVTNHLYLTRLSMSQPGKDYPRPCACYISRLRRGIQWSRSGNNQIHCTNQNHQEPRGNHLWQSR